MRPKIITGDILSVKSGVIAHGCNTQRIMGGGLALQIKNLYPQVYINYANHPTSHILGTYNFTIISPTLKIVNLIVQDLTQPRMSYDALDQALFALQRELDLSPQELHLPMIGQGIGKGKASILEAVTNQYNHTLWKLPT